MNEKQLIQRNTDLTIELAMQKQITRDRERHIKRLEEEITNLLEEQEEASERALKDRMRDHGIR